MNAITTIETFRLNLMSSYRQPIAHQHNPNIAMNSKQLYLDRIPQSTQTGQLIPTNTEPYNPGSWLKDGTSPAEIILATAILVSAIAGLLKVFKQQ